MQTLDAALAYTGRFGWPVFPVNASKRPLTAHGRSDATCDATLIREWFGDWPDALVAITTGAEAGIVAIDVDVRENVDGRDSLAALGVALHPRTPTSHTPSGGFHLLFQHPGGYVKTVAGKLGPGLDVRGDGGSITLPPGTGRYWDPHLLPSTTPLAAFPQWAVIAGELHVTARFRNVPPTGQSLSRYGEVALDNAVEAIVAAGAGEQEATLNRSCFGIGQLIAGGEIPAGLAEQALNLAASRMPSHDRRRPWFTRDLQRKVRDALFDGMKQPRRAARGR
jgi:hypothetical protein